MSAHPRPPRTNAITKAEAAELRALLGELRALVEQAASDASAARTQQQDIGPKILDLHGALMIPQPGHDRSLLERTAAVVIRVETGDRTLRAVVRTAQLLVAIGTIFAAVVAALKWGGGHPPTTHG